MVTSTSLDEGRGKEGIDRNDTCDITNNTKVVVYKMNTVDDNHNHYIAVKMSKKCRIRVV